MTNDAYQPKRANMTYKQMCVAMGYIVQNDILDPPERLSALHNRVLVAAQKKRNISKSYIGILDAIHVTAQELMPDLKIKHGNDLQHPSSKLVEPIPEPVALNIISVAETIPELNVDDEEITDERHFLIGRDFYMKLLSNWIAAGPGKPSPNGLT